MISALCKIDALQVMSRGNCGGCAMSVSESGIWMSGQDVLVAGDRYRSDSDIRPAIPLQDTLQIVRHLDKRSPKLEGRKLCG